MAVETAVCMQHIHTNPKADFGGVKDGQLSEGEARHSLFFS